MFIRKLLEPTVGCLNTSNRVFLRFIFLDLSKESFFLFEIISWVFFSLYPKIISIGRWIGNFPVLLSLSLKVFLAVRVPTTAWGHFSLSQNSLNSFKESFSTAKTYLSCDSLDHISKADIELSARGIFLKSTLAPMLQSFANSGIAFERPPAPTS